MLALKFGGDYIKFVSTTAFISILEFLLFSEEVFCRVQPIDTFDISHDEENPLYSVLFLFWSEPGRGEQENMTFRHVKGVASILHRLGCLKERVCNIRAGPKRRKGVYNSVRGLGRNFNRGPSQSITVSPLLLSVVERARGEIMTHGREERCNGV